MDAMITHLFAGVPVSDLDASTDWYTRFFGRPPDSRVGEEILWEIDEHAWLFIEPNAAQAGVALGPVGPSTAAAPGYVSGPTSTRIHSAGKPWE
jgi:catechol 2,3-dioxygenase-like lactoylglutathione lyase family enzyme